MNAAVIIAVSEVIMLALASPLEASSQLPTETKVEDIIKKCAMGQTVMGESSGQVDLAKLFYRQMVIEGKFRFDDIGGILGNLSSDQAKITAYSLYIKCIMNNNSNTAPTINLNQESNSGNNIYQNGGSIEINKR